MNKTVVWQNGAYKVMRGTYNNQARFTVFKNGREMFALFFIVEEAIEYVESLMRGEG